jgi:hypothetical protein
MRVLPGIHANHRGAKCPSRPIRSVATLAGVRRQGSCVRERFMTTRHIRSFLIPVIHISLASSLFWACGGDDDDTGAGGTGGKGGSAGKSAGGSAGKSTGGSGGKATGGSAGKGSGGSSAGESGAPSAGQPGSGGSSAGSGGSSAGEAGSGATSGSAGAGEGGSGGAGSGLSETCSSCVSDFCSNERTLCEASESCNSCLEQGGSSCNTDVLFVEVGTCACLTQCDGSCATECADPNFWQ